MADVPEGWEERISRSSGKFYSIWECKLSKSRQFGTLFFQKYLTVVTKFLDTLRNEQTKIKQK